jgi:dual oxidase
MGTASQIAEREDAVLCSDVRDNLFGPLEFSRRDLAAINVMRGRDHGLPDYNTVRKLHGMNMVTDWGQINPALNSEHPEIFTNLAQLYGSLLDIDLYVGGMLESVDGPGPLFAKIIKELFERIRDSDRFWFENQELG